MFQLAMKAKIACTAIAGFIMGVVAVLICIPVVNLFYKLFEKYPDFFLSRFVLTGSFKKAEQSSE